eukprot:TRINITY_DN2071_c1_g1_i1.p1 TRINITY_DN2071_c1_g1~~TRINITY_DN2071_c1_g1_i1.p1  ORF type:complete len:250 (-),score=54.85 TRINITY_DN2071_c1_g1_i1:123-872(-)
MDSHSTNRGSIHSTMATNAIPEPNGLTDQQINTIEQTHGFTFNQQHKAFLKQYGAHNSFKTTYRYFDPNEHADQGCPADFEGAYFRVPWVHLWSVAGDDEIPSADLLWTEDDDVAEANIDRLPLHFTGKPEFYLRSLAEGFHFDIENNGLWKDEWGSMPDDIQQRKNTFDQIFASAPKLIPVYGHRYAFSSETNCPAVLSVHQSDIIVYGETFEEYLANEFGNEFDLGMNVDKAQCTAPSDVPFWGSFL